MKKGILYSILLITFLCSNVVAVPIPIGLSSFSGTETVIGFNTIGSEVLISNQFSASGVIFSGAIYGLTNPGDTSNFPNNGNGVVASNWIYSQTHSIQGSSFSAAFDSPFTKVGFYLEANPGDDALVTVSYSGVSSGSLTFITDSSTAIFVGLEESLGFNNVTMTVAVNDNGFFAIDDFRFEGALNTTPGPAPVPEPSTLLLLSIGVTGLIGLKNGSINKTKPTESGSVTRA
jgi:hypothetical protein